MSNTFKNYFGSKKRDLSDKLTDGDKRKKTKEGSLAVSLNQDDANVFSEGIYSPKCALILYDCLKNVDKKFNKMHLLSTTTNDA